MNTSEVDKILLPVVQEGVTLNEIPDKIVYYFSIGNCCNHCKNCHSYDVLGWNCNPIGPDKCLDYPQIIKKVLQAKEDGLDGVLLMGGTCNKGVTREMLIELIKTLSLILPVYLYSGTEDTSLLKLNRLTGLKVGRYVEELGGLDNPTTNQIYYEWDNKLHKYTDCTYKFTAQASVTSKERK